MHESMLEVCVLIVTYPVYSQDHSTTLEMTKVTCQNGTYA